MLSKCKACNDSATLFCPLCQKAAYCSQKCRDYDWAVAHKNDCKPEIPRRHVSDFEIVSQGSLGRGSFGCVKLVRDRSTGLLYAMKMIDKADLSVENLKREVRIQKKLQHPHIIQLFDYFEDTQYVYLVLEYAANGSLFGYLRKRKLLPENEAFVYFFQTCLGIDYLHKNKIIHRDLKPENLLLDKEGNIKICDFGWSAEMMQTNTRTTFCGTIDYMTPEMLEDKPHDHTLDLWCLGVLLYELLHGHAPFKGRNDYEKCQNIQKQETFEISCSSDAKNLILALMKRTPSQRLPMEQIFEHEWVKRMAKSYDLDIQEYIYEFKNEKAREMLSQSMKLEPQKPTNTSQTTSFSVRQNQMAFSVWSGYSDEMPTMKPRVTKRTMAEQKEEGFFDSLMKTFGCTKR